VLKESRVNVDGAAMETATLRHTGSGWIDITANRLDLRIQSTVGNPATKDDRDALLMPLRVAGPITAPVAAPDLQRFTEGQSGQVLRQRLLESKEFNQLFENESLRPFKDSARRLLENLLK